jgi:signal transduction histidine kinase
MRRSVIWLAAAATSCVVVALVVALGAGLHRITTDEATVAASVAAQDLATVVGSASSTAQVRDALTSYEESVGGVRAVLVRTSGGSVFGDAATRARQHTNTPAVDFARTQGRTTFVDVDAGRELVVPVFRGQGPPDVLQVVLTDARLHRGLARSYLVLALLGVMLVVLATVTADRLGRSFVRPVRELAVTAGTLADGQLDQRVQPSGPPEVVAVGQALNQLADRISQLLERERERAGTIAHRLRTPLTALRLSADSLGDDEERTRVANLLTELERTVDAVIREARSPESPGERRCDAVAVVTERAEFWSMLAVEEQRHMDVDLGPGPLEVAAPGEELAEALDALLGNVFAHTEEGTALRVEVAERAGGGARIVVADEGPGISAPEEALARGLSGAGSTGLGLSIAQWTAHASGGELTIASGDGGGTTVELDLPAPRGAPALRTARTGPRRRLRRAVTRT